MTKSDQAKMLLQDCYALAEKNLQKEMDVSHATWDRLAREIRSALSLCRRGAVLSNNGRIEATYGKTMLEDMQHIVARIDEIMNQAVNGLKSLSETLK
jgi:hypothetical protein